MSEKHRFDDNGPDTLVKCQYDQLTDCRVFGSRIAWGDDGCGLCLLAEIARQLRLLSARSH